MCHFPGIDTKSKPRATAGLRWCFALTRNTKIPHVTVEKLVNAGVRHLTNKPPYRIKEGYTTGMLLNPGL